MLSDGPDAKIQVPVWTGTPNSELSCNISAHMVADLDRPQIWRAPQGVRFRDGGCYLIVGGLGGLRGSLAIHLAAAGASILLSCLVAGTQTRNQAML